MEAYDARFEKYLGVYHSEVAAKKNK